MGKFREKVLTIVSFSSANWDRAELAVVILMSIRFNNCAEISKRERK